MEDSQEAIKQQLDTIFKAHYHGAVNIRGIRYQLLYSILRAFDLYNEVIFKLQLSGVWCKASST